MKTFLLFFKTPFFHETKEDALRVAKEFAEKHDMAVVGLHEVEDDGELDMRHMDEKEARD